MAGVGSGVSTTETSGEIVDAGRAPRLGHVRNEWKGPIWRTAEDISKGIDENALLRNLPECMR